MRFEKTGNVTDNFYVAGSSGVPVYVLDGPSPALFDAGITVMGKIYVNDIKKILGDRSPEYLFLTHAHFDHTGSAGYFKRIWPDLKIVGSAQSRDILVRPGAIKLITALNGAGIERAQASGFDPINDTPFEPFEIEQVVGHGQRINLGPDLFVEALHMPGHTRDFTSYWISAKKILIASEAVGCEDNTGYIQAEFLVDYDRYLDNIYRLSHLDAEVLCIGHGMVLTGADVKAYMRRSIKSAKKYLFMVEGFLREANGNLETAAAKVKAVDWDNKPFPKQPEQPYLLNTRQRMHIIWERMQA